MKRISFALVLAALTLLSLNSEAQATTYYWDTDGATAGFGPGGGTWAAPTPGTTVGWSQSATGVTATGANVTTNNTDILNFGTAGVALPTSTITVSGTQTARSLTFGAASGTITLSGGTIDLGVGSINQLIANQSTIIDSAISKSVAGYIHGTVASGKTLTINGNINSTTSGTAGELYFQGAGSVILNGSIGSNITNFRMNSGATTATFAAQNFFTGLLIVGEGTGNTVNFSNVNQLGNPSSTGQYLQIINGSTLRYTGTTSQSAAARDLYWNQGAATIDVTSATGNLILNSTGPSNGRSGAFTKAGNGTLTLVPTTAGGADVTSATIAISGGTLALDTPGANGATWSSNISGAGNILKSGAGSGKLALSGTNTYGGTTTITGGTLQFAKQLSFYNNTPASWTAAKIIVNSGATAAFNVGGAGEFTSSDLDTIKLIGTGSGGFMNGSSIGLDTTNASGANFTYSTAIADTNGGANSIGLLKLGTNTLTLSAANTYTGVTTVTAGTLKLGDGTTDGTINNSAITNNATLNFNNVGAQTYGLVISGTGAVTKSGAGTQTLTGQSTYSGSTTISASGGTLQIGGAGSLGTAANYGNSIVINTGGTLQYSSSAAQTLSGAITGAGSLVKDTSASILTLSNASYTGPTTINAGEIRLTAANVGRGNWTINSGGILRGMATDSIDLIQSITVSAGGKLIQSGGSYQQLYNNGLGGTVLILNGGSVEGTVAGHASYGNFLLRGNVLVGGTQTSTISADFRMGDNANRTFTVNSTGDPSGIDLDITGQFRHFHGVTAGYMTKEGAGTMRFAATSVNTVYSLTNNAGKVLMVDKMDGWYSGIVNNATFEASISTGVDTAYPYTLAGTGTFIKSGAGKLQFNGGSQAIAQSQFNLTGGTLQNNNNSVNWSANTGNMDISSGAMLDLYADPVYVNNLTGLGTVQNGYAPSGVQNLVVGVAGGGSTFGGTIVSGGGDVALVKNGAGTFTLTNTNTYAGTTTISDGTLALSGSGSIASSPTVIVGTAAGSPAKFDVSAVTGGTYNVPSGQTIKGGGTIVGNISIGTGATIAPGNSPGTTNTVGTVTYAGGGNYQWEINNTAGTQGTDPGWDFQSITGALNITATSGSKFNVDITGLNTSNAPGGVANWNPHANYTWNLATASGGISGFTGSNQFNPITTNFTSNNSIGTGTFSVGTSGNNLQLTFAAGAAAAAAYWDIDGATAGPGGATPSGNWSTSDTNWSFNAAGTTATYGWTNGDDATFSAGTTATGAFNVNVAGGGVTAHNITVQEGTPTIQGGTLTLNGTTPTVDVATSRTGNINSVIDGTAGLTKSGAGTLVLGGASSNTYSGTTTLTGTGQLILSKTGGAVAIPGDINMSATGIRAILSTTADNQFGTSSVVSFPNAAGRDTRLELKGTTQTLAGLDSVGFTGTFAAVQHSELGSPAAVDGTSDLILNVTGSNSYTFGNAAGTAVIRNQGGIVALTKMGTGTQTLTGPGITYTGATTLSGGTLVLQNTTVFGSAVAVGASGTLESQRTGSGVGSRSPIMGNGITGTGIININNTANTANTTDGGWTSVSGGTGSLAMTGGTININSGVFSRDNVSANTINTSATVNVASGAGFGAGRGGNSTIGALNGSGHVGAFWAGGSAGSITIGNGGGSGSFSGVIHGNGNATDGNIDGGVMSVVKIGTGTQTFAGTNTYTGSTTLSGGTLNLNAPQTWAGAFVSDTANSTLNINATVTANNIFNLAAGAVTSTVNVNSGGTLNLAGSSALIGQNNSAAIGTLHVLSGGVLNITTTDFRIGNSAGNTTQGFLTLDPGSTVTVNAGTRFDVGNGNLSSGTVNLDGGTFTTSRNIVNGSATGDATNSVFNFNGGTLKAGASFSMTSDLTRANVRNGGAIFDTNGAGNTITIAEALLHSNIGGDALTDGGLTKNGAGTLTLSGANTYNGATTVNAGTLKAGVATVGGVAPTSGAFGVNSAMTINGGATLDLAGFNQTIGSLADNAGSGGTITSSTAGSITLITGGNNTSTSFAGTIQNGSGTVALTKIGSDTQTLSGANTYSGATTVQAGTLSLGTGGSIANSSVTVQSGAWLTGSGTTGALTIDQGGTHSPGNSPGTTNVVGNYTENGNLIIEILNHTGGAGIGYDTVNVTGGGSVSLGALSTLTVNYTGAPTAFNPTFAQMFTLINNDGTASGDTTGMFMNYNAEGSSIFVDSKELKLYYHDGTGGDANNVVLISNSGSTAGATLYVNNQWTSPATVDGDLETYPAPFDTAYVGVTAFKNVADLLTAQGSFAGDVIVNGGSYPSALLAGGNGITLNLVQDLESSDLNVTLQDISGDANDGITLRYHNAANANLTVEQGSFAGVISGNGTLTKTTGGTLSLSGPNTYSGTTTVSAGVLNIQNSTALGSAANGTTVASGAALELQGGIAVVGESLGITGTGVGNNGALRNISGSNSWSGGITLGGATEFQSDAGLLTLTGGINAGANALTVDGAGDITVSTNGITGAGASVAKNGAGTLLLSAANTYSGGTTVNAGTLHLAGGGLENSNIAVTGGTFRQTAGTNNVTGAGTGDLTITGSGQYQLQGGTLNFGDYAAGGTAWNPADTSTISTPTGAQFEFSGGSLVDVSSIVVGDSSNFTQQGGNFYVGRNDDTGPAALTTIDGGYSLLGGVMRLDVFGDDLTPEACCDGVPGNNDQLTVAGGVLLDSTIDLNFVGTYTPEFGDVFTLICASEPIVLDDGFHIDGGFFRLVPTGDEQFPFALQAIVPEPASVAVWTVIGLIGVAGAWRFNRKKKWHAVSSFECGLLGGTIPGRQIAHFVGKKCAELCLSPPSIRLN